MPERVYCRAESFPPERNPFHSKIFRAQKFRPASYVPDRSEIKMGLAKAVIMT
jgi:hypothetical protein